LIVEGQRQGKKEKMAGPRIGKSPQVKEVSKGRKQKVLARYEIEKRSMKRGHKTS